MVINNNEKYEQYITPQFCAFAQTSTLACNNVRPVVYPPSDGEHEAQGIRSCIFVQWYFFITEIDRLLLLVGGMGWQKYIFSTFCY